MSGDIKIELQSARVIADGKEFGNVGCYEYLTGWIHFEIEPNSPLPSKKKTASNHVFGFLSPIVPIYFS